MILFHGPPKSSERGIALIVALMLLLLISAALMGMIMMSNTETNVSANFRDEQTAFFASKAGIEEVRDRMRSNAPNSLITNTFFTPSPTPPPGTPLPLPGTANGVLYITNPAPGETVTPWLPLGTNYPDNEICQEVTCTSGVPTGSWYVTPAASASASYAASPILPWKWVRVMAKINKPSTSSKLRPVNGSSGSDTTAGYRVCWTGTNEIATAAASCPAASTSTTNYLPVYELTALAVTSSGSRRMTQYEVSRTAFPPMPGAMIFDGPGPSYSPNPNSAVFAVNGTDAAQGPNAGTGCGPAANQPGLGGYNGAAATSLGTQVNRPASYTGSPAGISNVGPQLGPLSTVDGLTNLVNSVTTAAGGNVYGASPLPNPSTLNLGTNGAPVINVVQGPLSLGGSGAGILLVTGDLTLVGGFSYNGIILVIGTGTVTKNGGGGGTLNGSMFVANMYTDSTHSTLVALGANNPPGPPSIGWNGGGNATFQYDSCWISAVTQSFPYRIVAQRELIY
jgi:Tfp pilus assembly protein PilX